MKALKVPVSKSYLANHLQQHPDYPSVLSITDTLDELGIDNMALEIEKENLSELPIPFMAHVNTNGGDYELIMDRSTFTNPYSEFYKRWTGVVIAAETPVSFKNPENENAIREENKRNKFLWNFIITLLVLSAFSVYTSGSWLLGILEALVICGIGIAILILMQELGFETESVTAICKRSKDADCTAVIKSNGAKLPLGFKWSDVGIIYFIGQWVILILAGFSGGATQILQLFKLLSVASVPFIVFSVYFQWRLAKKWCMLCLLVVGLLLLQMLMLLVFEPNGFTLIIWEQAMILALVFFGLGNFWRLIKSTLIKNKQIEQQLYDALRLKNNTDVFWSFLKQQRKVDISPFGNELEMAAQGSPLQVLVACNPYCAPCAKAHEILHEMSEKHKEKISITVRFGIDANKEQDIKTKTVKHILSILNAGSQPGPEYNRQVLHDWFSVMDINKFKEQYPLKQNVDVMQQMKEHDEWFNGARIEATPTIFVSGYQLPKAYSLNDLKSLISGLLNKQKEIQIITPETKAVENHNTRIPFLYLQEK